ncbi:MAG TPA: hypothetical protein VF179_22295 [Thermoanaerobaculia bacterium]|nr:hypothetical protein [Thermoanaerobaculia bacterium]
MDYGALIEFVGFDIIFLGLLTLLACCVTWQLWKSTPDETIDAFASGWRDYQEHLRCLDSDTKHSKRTLVGMLLMAALLGMLVNITGDRLLDTEELVTNIPIPGFWSSEDEIKLEAVKTIAKDLVAAGHSKAYLDNHNNKDAAQDLLQHAHVFTLSSDSERVVSMLRYEYIVVKVLRVLFLEATLLFFVAVCGPWMRYLLLKPRRKLGRAGFWRATLQLCLLLALPYLFLMLWSDQSKRYYKKVVYSYLVLADKIDVKPGLQGSGR